jgi:hypothetical protein
MWLDLDVHCALCVVRCALHVRCVCLVDIPSVEELCLSLLSNLGNTLDGLDCLLVLLAVVLEWSVALLFKLESSILLIDSNAEQHGDASHYYRWWR